MFYVVENGMWKSQLWLESDDLLVYFCDNIWLEPAKNIGMQNYDGVC